jgi:hypothetical protein
MNMPWRWPALIACTAALMACATPPVPTVHGAALQLPLLTGWFEGRRVRYITTDVSDAAVAQAKGVNFVPRLKEVLPEAPGAAQRVGSPLERVYGFDDGVQAPVFPSVPLPVGSSSRSLGYTPLWRLVQVRWKAGAAPRELRSEEAILDAEDRGELRLVVTDVVLNCPVLAVEGAGSLPPPPLGPRLAEQP